MASHNKDLFYDTALSLTLSAGKIIKEKTSDRNKHVECKTSKVDLVTETDAEVEKLLIGSISSKFPGHKFIAEESTVKGVTNILTDEPTWIIDPIDGTMNFVHSFPHVCISIALFINKEPEIGIVYNPILEQLFTARRGQGAFYNGKPIQVSDTKSLSEAVVMFEDCGDIHEAPHVLENTRWLLKEAHAIRILGSAVLEQCMVACGAADAYIQYGLGIWDVAATELIIKEAGGFVADTTGGPLDRFSGKILAASSKELIDVISKRFAQTEAKNKNI